MLAYRLRCRDLNLSPINQYNLRKLKVITPQKLNSSPPLITMGGYKFIIGKDTLIDN